MIWAAGKFESVKSGSKHPFYWNGQDFLALFRPFYASNFSIGRVLSHNGHKIGFLSFLIDYKELNFENTTLSSTLIFFSNILYKVLLRKLKPVLERL